MAQDLSGLYISQSFQNLVQTSASGAFNVLATATGTEFIPISASYAISSSHTDDAFQAESVQIPVRASENLAKGEPVYITGYNIGQERITVGKADASDPSKMPVVGLISESVVTNDNTDVYSAGIFKNVNTNGFTVGDVLYVKGAGGGLTNVKPTGSDLIQNVGKVGFANLNNGEITVSSILRTNDLPNLQEDYLWLGDVNGVPQAVPSSSLVTPTPNLQSVLQQGNSASIDLILSASAAGGRFLMNTDGTQTTLIDINDASGQNQMLYQASTSNNRFVLTPTGDQQGSILFSNNNSTLKDARIESTGMLVLEPSSSSPTLSDGKVQIDGLLHAPYSASVSESLDVSGSVNVDGNIAIGNPSLPGGIIPLNVEGNAYIANGALIASGSVANMLSVAGRGTFGVSNSNSNGKASLTVGESNSNQADSTFIQGENNTINSNQNSSAILAGTDHAMNGEKSAIIGGEGNTMNSSFSGIFGAAASTVTNADTSVIIGGYQQQLQGTRTYLLGGNDNQITNSGAEFSGIIGGQGHRIALPVTASAIIGGKNITATANNTVYVPNLSISGSLQDSDGSTGTNGLVLTSDGAGKVQWVAAPGGVAFPFTGSAEITGSLAVTGSVNTGNNPSTNTINPSALGAFVHGDGNVINSTGEDNVIMGGESNTISSGGYSAIIGAASSTLSNVDTSVILGGYLNNLQASRTFVLGGEQNQVSNASATFSGIIGGTLNNIPNAVTASVIIGGRNIVASKNETVYVPGLEAVSGGINSTGSIIGSTSIKAGQSAGAFASDSIELGSTSVPVQYGNMVIHNNLTSNLGNKYNGFQIVDQGGQTLQFANSAFTGLGNDVHFLGMGGNSTGRGDNIKMWSSGSQATLNFETLSRFSSGVYNDVNTITIASNTASLDLDSSNTFKFTAQSTATHIVPTNIKAGQVINIEVTQDVGGAGTITFDPAFKFPGGTAPTLTTTSNAIDLISAVSYDGTTLLANATQNYS